MKLEPLPCYNFTGSQTIWEDAELIKESSLLVYIYIYIYILIPLCCADESAAQMNEAKPDSNEE